MSLLWVWVWKRHAVRLPSAAAPVVTGNELAPADERLLTQQGGCLVFDGQVRSCWLSTPCA